jgi:hypothetical protein
VLEEAGIASEEEPAVTEEPTAAPVAEEPAAPTTELDRLEQQLDNAIRSEDYERAARLRDDIKKYKSELN